MSTGFILTDTPHNTTIHIFLKHIKKYLVQGMFVFASKAKCLPDNGYRSASMRDMQLGNSSVSSELILS